MTTPQSMREGLVEEAANKLSSWILIPEEFRDALKVSLRARLPEAIAPLEAAARAEERERCEFALAKWMLEQPDLRVNVDINLAQARQILTPTNPPNN